MVQIWYQEKLIVEDTTNDVVTADFDLKSKSDSVILHIIYTKGTEDNITVVPAGFDKQIPGAFPVQRMTSSGVQNMSVTIDADGNYTIPIPIPMAWDGLKISVVYAGDTTTKGDVIIYIKHDTPRS